MGPRILPSEGDGKLRRSEQLDKLVAKYTAEAGGKGSAKGKGAKGGIGGGGKGNNKPY